MTDMIYKAAKAVQDADAILIAAGAGMGVDSGLPDFRGNNGFWNEYPILRGTSFSEMANPDWFHMDPSRAWGFYGHRLNLYRETLPHEGFDILRSWSDHKPTFIYTSNVDGQFQKAGFDEDQICEIHGSIHWVQHVERGTNIWEADDVEVDINMEDLRAIGNLPREGKKLLRPNILMFGDYGWLPYRSNEQSRKYEEWLAQVDPTKLVIIEMGAGTAIPSVRYNSERLSDEGATLIRINPRESHDGDIQIPSGALQALLDMQEEINA